MARASVVAHKEDQGVFVGAALFEIVGDATDGVIQSEKQRKVASPIRGRDIGGKTGANCRRNLQRRMHRVVGKVQHPRLLLMAVHETDGLIGEDIGEETVEFL